MAHVYKKNLTADAIERSKDFSTKASSKLKEFISTSHLKVLEFQKESEEIELLKKGLEIKNENYAKLLKQHNELTESLHLLAMIDGIEYKLSKNKF